MSKSKKDTTKNTDTDKEQFPGYPQYPNRDDITIQNNRLSMDEQGLATSPENLSRTNSGERQDDIIVPSSRRKESDLTKEDLEALGPKDLSMDMGEDEEFLKHRTRPVDFSGEDLDVPGAELDDDEEAIGKEDEENNNYSLGADKESDLEEGHSL